MGYAVESAPWRLVVLPRKNTSQIALGIVTKEYYYRDAPDYHGPRHVIDVDWKRTDIPRTAVKQDLLFSLGATMAVCSIKRNDSAWRLHEVLRTGRDPGARVGLNSGEGISSVASPTRDNVEAGDDSVADASESDFEDRDLERVAMDRIQVFVSENFAGHRLSYLAAEVLKAEGFLTEESPPGPDGGIDVLAGRGPLGLDRPRLVVQVKSSLTPIDVKIVRELNGVLANHSADNALLVAWGGVNRAARKELRNQFFKVRIWDADDLLEAILRNYDKLSEALRAELSQAHLVASRRLIHADQ